MPQTSLSKAARFALIALLVPLLLQVSCVPRQPVTIRLAGDEWFLDSLTQTGMIGVFEKQSGIHVEVLHRNDRTIMSDLDRGPSSSDAGLDVVVMRHRWLGALVQKGQDAVGRVYRKSDYHPGALVDRIKKLAAGGHRDKGR